MEKHIAVFNTGSSSVRFKLYDVLDNGLQARLSGAAMGIGTNVQIRSTDGELQRHAEAFSGAKSHPEVLAFLLDWLDGQLDVNNICGIGHRVVHGGGIFHEPVRIDEDVIVQLESFVPLAPHHQANSLIAIRSLQDRIPRAVQVACFDTGFHHTLPPVERSLGLPKDLQDKGYRRYGFHGLSYAYISSAFERVIGLPLPQRTVIAHLGNGASLCAVRDGKSIATTMGYSTLDGLIMGTRCGSVDPGALLALMRDEKMTPDEVEDLLYNRSGLLGLSGVSADMRTLLENKSPAVEAALDIWVNRIAGNVGRLASSLGGIDAMIFTGGIGENAHEMRAAILSRLKWLGFALDAKANAANEPCITLPGSALPAWVMSTDEEGYIALCTRDTLSLTQNPFVLISETSDDQKESG